MVYAFEETTLFQIPGNQIYIPMTLHVKLCTCKVPIDRNVNFCLNVEVNT